MTTTPILQPPSHPHTTHSPPTPHGRPRSARRGEPTWAIAELFPAQGEWPEDRYLAFDFENRRVEYVNGFVEFLPMPTLMHERITRYFFLHLYQFVAERDRGEVFFSGIRVQLAPRGEKQFRVPDVVFMRHEHAGQMGNMFWQGADLAVEVVSPDDPKRDLEEKRTDYARGGIPEYWIVDPRTQDIHVLCLNGDAYDVRGTFRPGDTATSALLDGFAVDVAAAFQAGREAS